MNKLPTHFYLIELTFLTEKRVLKTTLANLRKHFCCWKQPNTVTFTNGETKTVGEILEYYPLLFKNNPNLAPKS